MKFCIYSPVPNIRRVKCTKVFIFFVLWLFNADEMVLIYSDSSSNRLKYISQLLLEDLIGTGVRLTENREEFLLSNEPAINYSSLDLKKGLHIHPAHLLFEKGVFDTSVAVSRLGPTPILFPAAQGDFPFDIFAAAFYMVTRYEEYLDTKKDKYGRFKLKHSLAFVNGFYDIPVVNIWAGMLAARLKDLYPDLIFKPEPYRFVPTIDVDHAFAYKYRTLWRTLGGIGRSVARMEFAEVPDRLLVLSGLRNDPFDTYDYLLDFHRRLGILPWFFILFADYGGNDNNVRLNRKGFLKLLARLADEASVGIHPSLSSNRSMPRLEKEIHGLSAVIGRELTSTRQHFLKISMPRTYRRLVTLGFTDDFSMGFSAAAGFRAGIASPFRFFDLFRNDVTPLMMHPVTCMDVTFRDHLNLSPLETTEKMKHLTDLVRSVNGEFIPLWHNESLSDTGRWKGWRKVYEETTAYAAGKEA